ncbi:hypothetical protein D1007_04113 [Hordeum vulgare]|nr:hypothetical protein D1007_04113 [Hordeum vulgare]
MPDPTTSSRQPTDNPPEQPPPHEPASRASAGTSGAGSGCPGPRPPRAVVLHLGRLDQASPGSDPSPPCRPPLLVGAASSPARAARLLPLTERPLPRPHGTLLGLALRSCSRPSRVPCGPVGPRLGPSPAHAVDHLPGPRLPAAA